MRIVAVSQRSDFIEDRKEYRDALDQNIVRFLFKCGFMTVPVPNIFRNNLSDKYFNTFMNRIKPQAFLLTGGNNIGESPERDQTELAIIGYAEQKKLPLLGICRGMQMMAFRSGTSLVPILNHAGKRHKINGEISSTVNSYHDFCIKECPQQYTVLSRSNENAIEAIKHCKLPWEGWMWHPERELPFEKRDIDRLTTLFNGGSSIDH